jgi:hypothetical protein
MASRLAKVRFIADSINATFWGSNTQEQAEIEMIRREFAPYLYDRKPPKKILNKLGPIAERLIANTRNVDADSLASMYEPK